MSTRTGLTRQLGIVDEVTPGTAVTVTRFVPQLPGSSGFTNAIERVVSDAIIPGEHLPLDDQVRTGSQTVTGSFQTQLMVGGQALLWKHILGTLGSPSGSGPYTYVASLGSLDGKALTMQDVVPSTDGTARAFTAAGCKITSAAVGFAVGEAVTLGLDVVAMSLVTNVAVASASYGTLATKPYMFHEGAVSIASSAYKVRSGTFTVNNPLNADRRFAGQATTSEPLQNARRDIMLEVEGEFNDLTHYDAFVAGTTPVAVELAFTSGSYSVTIAGDFYYDDANVGRNGYDIAPQPLTLRPADDSDFDVTIVNPDSAA